jgi:hypothetical protein
MKRTTAVKVIEVAEHLIKVASASMTDERGLSRKERQHVSKGRKIIIRNGACMIVEMMMKELVG